MFEKLKEIKDTVFKNIKDTKPDIEIKNTPLRDFNSREVGEGFFPIGNYVNTNDIVDIHSLPIGMEENRASGLLYTNCYQENFLIAGYAGGGKSVVIASIISLIANTNAVMYGIDLKQTELEMFDDRFAAIAHSHKSAIILIDGLMEELENRLNYLNNSGEIEINSNNNTYPPIILVIDEYAEIILPPDPDDKKLSNEIMGKIITLTKLSQNTGLSVFIATQSPKKNIITDELMDNINNRIGLAVSTNSQLKLIIGETADDLEIPTRKEQSGYFVKGDSSPIKFKPLYSSNEDREKVNRLTKKKNKPLINKSMGKFSDATWRDFVNNLKVTDNGKEELINTKNTANLANNLNTEDGKIIYNYIKSSKYFSKFMAKHYGGYEHLDMFVENFKRRVENK